MTNPKDKPQNKINLHGEVIEIFDNGCITSAKIKFKEAIYQIRSSKLKGLHLGDFVNIESILNLDSVEENFNNQYQ